MPRKARIDAPGALHHIISRGIERQKIFRNDRDRDDFLNRLGEILLQTSTRCYAWALIPNHFHLLLKTGTAPISDVMRSLLTGYAISYNRRYRRHGHLFQNRYKSILCQEESYLLELVRYIHLNPLRAKLVTGLNELDRYRYSGHGALRGHFAVEWQETAEVLLRFSKRAGTASSRYGSFVAEGVASGKRQDLTGGGLVRSAGGWQALKELRGKRLNLLGDERILGDSDFVDTVLRQAEEELGTRERHRREGLDFARLLSLVANRYRLEERDLVTASKQPLRVEARSLLSYLAVRELGLRVTAVAASLAMTQPAGSRAVHRGERIAREKNLQLSDLLKDIKA